jgi:ABC-type transporter Mla subunit MlaD
MANINDIYDRVGDVVNSVNDSRNALHADLQAVIETVNSVNETLATTNQLLTRITQQQDDLIEQSAYQSNALLHISQQEDTVICILEHVSKNTCEVLNTATIQTRLQQQMHSLVEQITVIAQSAHPAGALEFKRLEEIKREIERCCPPEPQAPACTYTPCPAPGPAEPPPAPPQRPPPLHIG